MVHQAPILPDLFHSDRHGSRHHPLCGRTVPDQANCLSNGLRFVDRGGLFAHRWQEGTKLGFGAGAINGSDDLARICDGDFLHDRRPDHRNQNA